MKKLFYFAYGSNLLQSRIEDRIGDVIKAGTHRLYGWKLAFNCGYNKFSYANIVEATPKEYVEGVLYEVTSHQMSILDKYEGLYEKEFFLLDNNEIAFVYISTLKFYKSKALPEKEYINLIIEGALENNLIATYNALVRFKTDVMGIKSKHKLISR